MYRFECIQKNFESEAELGALENMWFEGGGRGQGSGDDAGCRVLNQLELTEGFVVDTEEKQVAGGAGGDENVNRRQ